MMLPTRPAATIFGLMPRPSVPTFWSGLLDWPRRAAWVLILVAATGLWAVPTNALNLFATHQVTAQFATPDGKPMANAEVRVFAPGDPNHVALTGRTDSQGKFVFDTDRDGFWTAEARSADDVARVMIRVGGQTEPQNRLSPFLIIGVLAILLGIAIWYRWLRVRTRGPRS